MITSRLSLWWRQQLILNPYTFPGRRRGADVSLHVGIAVRGSTVRSSKCCCNPPTTQTQVYSTKDATVDVSFLIRVSLT